MRIKAAELHLKAPPFSMPRRFCRNVCSAVFAPPSVVAVLSTARLCFPWLSSKSPSFRAFFPSFRAILVRFSKFRAIFDEFSPDFDAFCGVLALYFSVGGGVSVP